MNVCTPTITCNIQAYPYANLLQVRACVLHIPSGAPFKFVKFIKNTKFLNVKTIFRYTFTHFYFVSEHNSTTQWRVAQTPHTHHCDYCNRGLSCASYVATGYKAISCGKFPQNMLCTLVKHLLSWPGTLFSVNGNLQFWTKVFEHL